MSCYVTFWKCVCQAGTLFLNFGVLETSKQENILMQTRVIFLPLNMMSFINYITATLRALLGWSGSLVNISLEKSLYP